MHVLCIIIHIYMWVWIRVFFWCSKLYFEVIPDHLYFIFTLSLLPKKQVKMIFKTCLHIARLGISLANNNGMSQSHSSGHIYIQCTECFKLIPHSGCCAIFTFPEWITSGLGDFQYILYSFGRSCNPNPKRQFLG